MRRENNLCKVATNRNAGLQEEDVMQGQTTNKWVYTAEQKERWDKSLNGPGYYQVVGETAFTFLGHKIARLVDNPDDPKTVLLIGTEEKCSEFLRQMVKC